MRRTPGKVTVFVLAVCAVLAPAFSARAASFTIFGPSTYVRRSGPPQEEVTAFLVPENVQRPLRLVVHSGHADGSGRVTEASIDVNGVSVIGASDFNPGVSTLVRDTALVPGEKATVRVHMAGAPGSLLRVSIEGSVSPDVVHAEQSAMVRSDQETRLDLPGIATLKVGVGSIPAGGEVRFSALSSAALDLRLSLEQPMFVPLAVPAFRVKSATSVAAPLELRIALDGVANLPTDRPVFAMALLNHQGDGGESHDAFAPIGGEVCDGNVLCVTLPVESFLDLNPLDPADPVAVVRIGTLQLAHTPGQQLWTVSGSQSGAVVNQGQPVTVSADVALQIPRTIAFRSPLPPGAAFGSGYWRSDGRPHRAIDLPAVVNTRVSAVLPGDVVFAGRDGERIRTNPLSCGRPCNRNGTCDGGQACARNAVTGALECHVTTVSRGEYIQLNHFGSDVQTWYQHLKPPPAPPIVTTGTSVGQGQEIARSGDTPATAVCGPHLHFAAAFHWNGRIYHVDPVPLLKGDPSLFLEPPPTGAPNLPPDTEPARLRFTLARRGASNSLATIDQEMVRTPFPASATFPTSTLQPGDYEIVLSLRGSRFYAPPQPGIRLASWDVTVLRKVTLSITKGGSGTGTVSSVPAGIACGTTCSAEFNAGTQVTLTATPDPGFTFSKWTGSCSGSTSPVIVDMDQDKTCVAEFEPDLAGCPTVTGSRSYATFSSWSVSPDTPRVTGSETHVDRGRSQGTFAYDILLHRSGGSCFVTVSVSLNVAAAPYFYNESYHHTARLQMPGIPLHVSSNCTASAGSQASQGDQACVAFMPQDADGGSSTFVDVRAIRLRRLLRPENVLQYTGGTASNEPSNCCVAGSVTQRSTYRVP